MRLKRQAGQASKAFKALDNFDCSPRATGHPRRLSGRGNLISLYFEAVGWREYQMNAGRPVTLFLELTGFGLPLHYIVSAPGQDQCLVRL